MDLRQWVIVNEQIGAYAFDQLYCDLYNYCEQVAANFVDQFLSECVEMDNVWEYKVRYTAEFETSIRTSAEPGSQEFNNEVNNIDIPQDESIYCGGSFKPISATDIEVNTTDL